MVLSCGLAERGNKVFGADNWHFKQEGHDVILLRRRCRCLSKVVAPFAGPESEPDRDAMVDRDGEMQDGGRDVR
jgi:hypothetical protein